MKRFVVVLTDGWEYSDVQVVEGESIESVRAEFRRGLIDYPVLVAEVVEVWQKEGV